MLIGVALNTRLLVHWVPAAVSPGIEHRKAINSDEVMDPILTSTTGFMNGRWKQDGQRRGLLRHWDWRLGLMNWKHVAISFKCSCVRKAND